jgi:hypothetical protein
MEHPHRVRQFILALAGMVCLCVLAAVFAFFMRPPQFHTRIDAITYTLQRHGARVEQVVIERGWPDQINNTTYTTSIRVRTREYGDLGGRYECRDGEKACWVAVPKLQIDMVPVPDLSEPTRMPLLDWLEQHYNALRAGKLPW